jgi:hypothetical protein
MTTHTERQEASKSERERAGQRGEDEAVGQLDALLGIWEPETTTQAALRSSEGRAGGRRT